MGNKHVGSYDGHVEDVAREVEGWGKAGGESHAHGPHQGNASPHIHLNIPGDRNNNFVLNIDATREPGSGIHKK